MTNRLNYRRLASLILTAIVTVFGIFALSRSAAHAETDSTIGFAINDLPHFQSANQVNSFLSQVNYDLIAQLQDIKNITPSAQPVPDWVLHFYQKIIAKVLHNDPRFKIRICDGCGSTNQHYTVYLDLGMFSDHFSNLPPDELRTDIQFVVAHEISHIVEHVAEQTLSAKVPPQQGRDLEDWDPLMASLKHAEVDLIALAILSQVGAEYPYGGENLIKTIMTVPRNASKSERSYILHDRAYRVGVLRYAKSAYAWPQAHSR